MSKSYTSNYFRIYFWQALAIILNFLSMLIVTPRLSQFPVIYGIYSFCFSTAIFFSYADLGFLGAGYKYMSESFAKNDLEGEIKIIGFVSFILFIFVSLYTIAIIAIAKNPAILVKNLNNAYELKVASSLLWILALFSPVTVIQRFLQTVCGIRLEDFIYQRVSIISSVVKLSSVFYFFRFNHYDIIGYFLFSQLTNLFAGVSAILIVNRRYHYDFRLFIKYFRFSKESYLKTKKLAFSSLYTTLAFIVFFEFDLIVIAKLLGPKEVAFYAVGLTLLSVFRSIYGIIYGPFGARFNHFVGLNRIGELKELYKSVIILTIPLVVFPLLSTFLLMKPFIYSWVGSEYQPSLAIAKFLVLCFIFGFISYPASILIIAKEKIKLLYLISTMQMAIFWAGVLLTFHAYGIVSFAFFKFAGFSLAAVIYLYISLKFIGGKLIDFLKKIIAPLVVPAICLIIILIYLNRFMPQGKNKLDVLIIVLTGGIVSAGATGLYYLFSGQFKDYINGVFKKMLKSERVSFIRTMYKLRTS